MPDRPALPIHDSGTAFSIPIAFSTAAVDASRLIRAAGHRAASLLAVAGSAFPADSMGDGHAAVAPVPASRLPLRAGLALRGGAARATRGHHLPPGVVMNGTLPVREAVMRGRARALPFFSKPPAERVHVRPARRQMSDARVRVWSGASLQTRLQHRKMM